VKISANEYELMALKLDSESDLAAPGLESPLDPGSTSRFILLNAAALRDLPPLEWRMRGVLPAVGLAG
jgi:putative DNA primase/helicase